MSELQELLAVNHRQAFEFFYTGLIEIPPVEKFHVDDILYVTSCLAHYAQTSCVSEQSMPAPQNLMDIFDQFILNADGPTDLELVETAGAQSLLMVGFFRDYMRRRHHVRWFDKYGRAFFARASVMSQSPRKRALLGRMSENFRPWAYICRNLHRRLREKRYILH